MSPAMPVWMSGWRRLFWPFRWGVAFFVFFVRRFCADRGLQVATQLSYTTLLSIVPLMAVAFGLLAAFPNFANIQQRIQGFVFENFVPAAGKAIEQHLLAFTGNASQVTGFGIVFLVVTALMMMSTIDRSFNAIWQVRERRNVLASFTVYWAILTLVPLLIGASLVVTSDLGSSAWVVDVTETFERQTHGLRLFPFLASTLAFFMLYVVVPNRRVPMLHALLGALLAALLFEGAKRGFAFYISSFPALSNIYGAMATVPIFLIWIFLVWLVALLGAEFTRSLSTFRAAALGEEEHHPGGDFVCAYRLLGHLWQAQVNGRSLRIADFLDREPALAEDRLLDLVTEFERQGLVQRTRDRGWVLIRDLGELTLADLYNRLPYAVRMVPDSDDTWGRSLHRLLDVAVGNLERHMDLPLKNLYQGDLGDFGGIAPAKDDPA